MQVNDKKAEMSLDDKIAAVKAVYPNAYCCWQDSETCCIVPNNEVDHHDRISGYYGSPREAWYDAASKSPCGHPLGEHCSLCAVPDDPLSRPCSCGAKAGQGCIDVLGYRSGLIHESRKKTAVPDDREEWGNPEYAIGYFEGMIDSVKAGSTPKSVIECLLRHFPQAYRLSQAQPDAPLLRHALHRAITELSFVQSVENCTSSMCATDEGRACIEYGMKALGVTKLFNDDESPTVPDPAEAQPVRTYEDGVRDATLWVEGNGSPHTARACRAFLLDAPPVPEKGSK